MKMTIDEILANKELAIARKKAEIQKSDYSNVLFESVQKAASNDLQVLEVLVYEAVIDKRRNEEMHKNYLNGWVLNHSVGMRYIKLVLCYNNDSPEYTQEKENYDKYYNQIFNKEDVDRWFWAILEAKNIEASSVVKGSNFLTPVLSMEIIDENRLRVKLAVSPSNVYDSHGDVHFPNIWNKTIKENKYDLLLQEHEMDFNKVITDSITGELKVYTEQISVKTLLSMFNKKEAVKNNTSKQEKNEPSNDTQIERLKEIIKKL